MKELEDKYKKWHENTDHLWKYSVIEKCRKEGILYIDTNRDINWIYEDCLDYIFNNSTRKINNLAKKLGYKEIPCLHCRNIIKYWNDSDEWRWSPDKDHLFNA